MCHTHGANNLIPWVHGGISYKFIKEPNPEANWRTGNTTHPLHASFHLLSMQAPRKSQPLDTWFPCFPEGLRPKQEFLSLETMHYPPWVQLYNFRLSELIGSISSYKPQAEWMLKSSLGDTWPLCPLMSFLSHYALQKNTVDKCYLGRHAHIL